MKGNPKYKYGDIVSFRFKDKTITGKVYIVDAFGVFEDNSDVHYDIMADNCLYKHIREDGIIEV